MKFIQPFSLLFFFVFNLFSFKVAAQDVPPISRFGSVGPTTEMTFEEPEFSFGQINEGEIVSHTFTFTNTGDEVMIVSNAKGSCGCTVPMWPREPILPGETASITVEFNSKGKKGPRNQKVTITANTNPPQTFIALVGEVIPKKGDTDLEYNKPDPEAELAAMDCIAVYPNPTSDLLKLDLKESFGKSADVGIYSKGGQLMAKRTIEDIDGTIEFSVGHYPAGAYIAKVQVAGQQPIARCFVVRN